MRLLKHDAFRETLSYKINKTASAGKANKYFIESPDWIDGAYGPKSGYFYPGSDRMLRRFFFRAVVPSGKRLKR